MKYLFFLSTWLLVFVPFGYAQDFTEATVKWGPEEERKGEFFIKLIGSQDEYTYTAWGQKGSLKIQKLNERLEPINEILIERKYQGKSMDYEFSLLHGKAIRLFFSFYNKKAKKKYLLVKTLNLSDLNVMDELKTIGSIDAQQKGISLGRGSSSETSGAFSYSMSRDENKLMIFFGNPGAKPGYEGFTFQVYNQEFEKEWEKEVELPYVNKLFSITDIRVDNPGNIHIAGKEYKPGRNENKRSEEFDYRIISWYQDTDRVTDYKVALQDEKIITDLQYAFNDKGELVCSGFYSNDDYRNVTGTFFLRIAVKDNKLLSRSIKEFDFEFVTQFMSDRQKKKAVKKEARGRDVELYEYDLDDIVLRDDGGAILIGEQYYVQVVTRTSTNANGQMRTTTDYYYHFKDLIVVNISPEGNIDWNIRIPKIQVTRNDGGYRSSYHLKVVNNKIYFLFYDDDDNFELDPDEKPQRGGFESIALVELEQSGEYVKYKFIPKEDIQVSMVPKQFSYLNEQEVLLYGSSRMGLSFSRRKYQFSRLVFKKE
ncbi:MAG: hypothetical protein ACFB10_01390 [Salibacteraceae bacterium]